MTDGPENHLGQRTMKWFKRTSASDATFKLLISPTPIIDPIDTKKDNHSNKGFFYEGTNSKVYRFTTNMYVVCGDRHWQYVSKHSKYGIVEFSIGPQQQ